MIRSSMADLKPEAKKRLEDAYKKFESSLREIAREHRTTVSRLFGEVDKTVIKKMKERIEKEA